MAWKLVLGPKDQGGLGVGSLACMNWALLYKWLWRFKSDSTSLWKRVICGIHNNMRNPFIGLAKKSLPGIWYNVVKVAQMMDDIGFDSSSIFQI